MFVITIDKFEYLKEHCEVRFTERPFTWSSTNFRNFVKEEAVKEIESKKKSKNKTTKHKQKKKKEPQIQM